MSTLAEPTRLARKDVEELLAIIKRLARTEGNTVRYALNGTGHINVCNADGDPYRLPDGSKFTIPTTPKPHGGWRKTALHNAATLGLVSRRALDAGKRKANAAALQEERAALAAQRAKLDERIDAIDRKLGAA